MTKVLYIEDHPSQRELLAQMLELSGFEVQVAEDGLAGLELARAWYPDVIVTDLRMPRMDGVAAIGKIRESEKIRHTPIIALSAWNSGDNQQKAIDAGANRFLAKPVDIHRLIKVIKDLLGPDP